jgi:hypothetical protein
MNEVHNTHEGGRKCIQKIQPENLKGRNGSGRTRLIWEGSIRFNLKERRWGLDSTGSVYSGPVIEVSCF